MSKKHSHKSTQKLQQQRMLLALGGGVVAMAIVGLIFLLTSPSGAELPDGVKDRYEGIDQSTTIDGFPQLGNPNAPILVREYSSFTCPHCKDLSEEVIVPDLLPYIRNGQVRLVFVPLDRQTDRETDMNRAAFCASEQGKFFEMADVIFHWLGLVSYDNDRAIEAAGELGMDKGDFEDCINSNRTDPLIQRARQAFTDAGLTGTPSVFLNRDRVSDPFNSLITRIDELLAAEEESEQ